MFCVILIVTLVIICLCAAILPPVFILVLRQHTISLVSKTNLSTSVCSTSTCIGSESPYRWSITTILFPFDGNYNDQSGFYSGYAYGTSAPSYSSGTSYVRQAIELYVPSNQYIAIPDVSLRQQSFTIEFWFLISNSGTSVDYGLFSQCGTDSICLGISIRSGRIVVSFDSMNNSTMQLLVGSTVTSVSYWYHVAVVYDATLRQQLIYLNGKIDAITSGTIEAYQGTSVGSVTLIGRSSSFNYPSSNFHGYVDEETVLFCFNPRVK